MKKFTKMIVGVFCALLLVTSAYAADTAVKASANAPVAVQTVPAPAPASAWTMTFGGAGAITTKGVSESALGLNLSLGRTTTLVLPFEAGIRQSFGYASADGGSTLFGTKAYADWTLLKIGPVDLFAGGNIGAIYGNTPMQWTAAPEAGVDVWVLKNVALEGRVEYPFDLNPTTEARDYLSYFLGVKFKF